MVQLTHILIVQFNSERESFVKSQSGLVKKPFNEANHGEFFTFVHSVLHVQFGLTKAVLLVHPQFARFALCLYNSRLTAES